MRSSEANPPIGNSVMSACANTVTAGCECMPQLVQHNAAEQEEHENNAVDRGRWSLGEPQDRTNPRE